MLIAKKHVFFLIIGIVLMILEKVISYPLSAFTIPAIILILGAKPAVSFLVIGAVALIISALFRDIKNKWFPIVSVLFLLSGIFDFVVIGYSVFIVEPKVINVLAQQSFVEEKDVSINEIDEQKPRDLFAENPEILFKMAYEHMRGDGVPQSHSKALEYLRRAAQNGYSEAQYNLGFMYLRGVGVQEDLELAKEWFRKASSQGNQGAIETLSRIDKQSHIYLD